MADLCSGLHQSCSGAHYYLCHVAGQLRHMGPGWQLLGLSVAPLMDGAGCDGLGLGFVMYELLHR